LGRHRQEQTNNKNKKTPFLAAIWPAKSKQGFSSGSPLGTSVVHFNPFSCLAFFPLKAEFAVVASEVLNHFS